jgi:uncharacterized FAD-dependent dehydrogenase
MRTAVIGFGAAAIGYLLEAKNTNEEVHVFEKAKDIFSSSVSGIRADGKIFVSQEMGGELEVDLDLQKRVVDYYLNNTDCKENEIERGFSFRDRDYYKNFYEKGFQPIQADFYHIGTDELKNVLTNIFSDLNACKNLHFHFDSKVENVTSDDKFKVECNGETTEFDRVIVAVGRSGHKLVKKIIGENKALLLDNTKVDLGVRFELPDHIVEKLNKEMYEFKVKYRTETGYSVRTFCNNPSGYVVAENYGDFVTVNGHAKMNEKSENTNFAILVTHSFTQPFNDPIGYGSYIAKLSNILAGGDKVILQTYGDFKRSKRTKHLNRVIPTLESEKYILGDLNLVFPSKTTRSIVSFIEKLNEIIPGVGYHDNLLYGTEVKFYSNKLDNNLVKGLYFIGDCSGWTRSITYATAHGIMLAKTIR